MDIKEAIKKFVRYKKGEPVSSLRLIYDSPDAHLESIYFWLFDFLEDITKKDIIKITDNFASSPGSGHFSEIGARATKMQEEGMKILGAVNQVIKSSLNLLYDLKEFEIRLGHYEKAKSKDAKEKEAAMLALKQIWLDNVDMKRGRGSITQMTYELGFTTLRDAFMVCNTLEEVDKNEIVNEQVKRVIKPRLAEFLAWLDLSEKELRKRFEIEKAYLKSQVETIKLYTSWAKPYLKAAQALQQKGFEKNAALISAFNTSLFELVILGKSEQKISDAVYSKKLPREFENHKLKRKYYSCYLISLNFRGFPQKVSQQHYGFGGEVTINFNAYVMNDEEIALVLKTMEKEDVFSALSFVEETSTVALDQLKEDIEHFLEDKNKKEKEKKEESSNPFSALWSIFKKSSEKKEEKKIEKISDIKKDSFIESEVRILAEENAKKGLFKIYDIYKKAHAMASSPEDFDAF